MLMPVLMSFHDQKVDVVPHFDHLDVRNVMVPLMVPLASCDPDAGTSSIT